MYLHLGQDVVVATSEVVAIIDLAAVQRRGFQLADVLQAARRRGELQHLADGAGTSLVITSDRIYVSPISPLTLRRRAMAPWAGDGTPDGATLVRRRTRRRRPARRPRPL